MKNIFEKILSIQKSRRKAALCIVVSTKGSTPRKAGAKMIVYENKEVFGTIGGGNLEKKVIENALQQIKENIPKYFKHDLLHQHNMCCGGTAEIYIEPIMQKKKLYIFGAGHTGKALAKYAVYLDFDIIVIDDRKEYLDDFDVPDVDKMNLTHQLALQALPFDENTFIAILTYSHDVDREILAYCLKKPYTYLGMIGSQRKIEVTKKMFIEGEIATTEELAKVDMPMGLNILAESPDEIAISILAKLIEVKNKVV